jgi:hypothetical protein
MSQQVQRIGGQLLAANLQRELADLAFDTDLLVVKRDNTLGINTTTTPRNLTVNGTLRTASGTSDPDIIFGNSITVGDLTLSTTGATAPTGNITIESTHADGYITAGGLGSLNFAVKANGAIEALNTNGSLGFRSTYFAGQTQAWNDEGNYGDYWYPGPKNSASAPSNDGDALYAEAQAIATRGAPFSAEELAVFDWDTDGDIQADDILKTLTLNSQFTGGQYFPASRTLGDHPNPTALKNYIIANYPNSYPRQLQLQTGGTLNVAGNVHATGNITYGGGTLTIGDDSTDSARFLAEFKNPLIPDQDLTYTLGRDDDSTGPDEGKRFSLYANTLETNYLNVVDIIYQGVRLTKDVKNIFVSQGNGSDLNRGTHPGAPYATIQKALSVATEDTIIYIYPGQYQEAFPLTVPKGVTIQGDSLRSVEIYPTTATQSEDCFLIEGETQIENITIKDFFYDSGNDKGYGFRFKNAASIMERSPYIRNCTVITKGSSTSASDIRGFASGDAGKGALVDGSSVDQASPRASMLFYGTTFITPGVDALTMRDGVRVEWLNSFSYFANHGILIEQGTTGNLLPDSTRIFGGEIRSIASAAVYGNYGVKADGANCLAYLINSNFAYIGSGKDVTNDNTLTIEANKVVEANNGKVYYTSQDEKGNFNVGDLFSVDQVNGRTSFDIESIFANNSVVRILTDTNEVFINSERLSLDNIVVTGNTIFSTNADLNVTSATDTINFNANVNTTGNVDVTGNGVINGSVITIGDDISDTIDFNTPFSQNLEPGSSDGNVLGTETLAWRTGYGQAVSVNDIRVTPSLITTTESNSNLELIANGTGNVNFENVQLKDNKLIGKFSPAGSFTIIETDENVIPIFNSFESLKQYFPYCIIWNDIPIFATANVSRDALFHTANLLAGYFDNDYDGVIDNSTVYAQFSDGQKGIAIYADAADESAIATALGNWKLKTTSVYQSEMNNYQGDSVSGNRDVTLERLLRYYIIEKGYVNSYADLGTSRPTTITAAMDIARGGYQAGGLPNYSYPPFAWYTDPVGIAYDALVIEYLYLSISSYAGSQAWRSGDNTLTDKWSTYSRALLEATDTTIVPIITNGTYSFPLTQPVLDYWTQVTNTIGGTSRDLDFVVNDTLKIDATSHAVLSKGTNAQRPSTTGAIRYNTTYNSFEGVVGGGAVSLAGIFDTDRDTFLDLSNNQYQFTTAGVTNHTLNGTLLESGGLSAGDTFFVNGNTVSAVSDNQNVTLRSNGTGTTNIETLTFRDSILTDTTNAPVFSFNLTNTNGEAFVKFDNVNGMVVPYGTDAQRPSTPEVGHTRFSTTNEYLETYNGTTWINAAGQVEAILEDDVSELSFLWNLILD